MAQKLVKYFDYAKEKGGNQALMRLALKTGIPSTKAQTTDDASETLDVFHNALKEILQDPNVPKL